MPKTTVKPGSKQELNGVGDGGNNLIAIGRPYAVHIKVVGVAPLLLHAWNTDAVEAKGRAAKGSEAKKTDDIESYVYRCVDGSIGIPGEYLRGTICNPQTGAAKYRQDPRSPRKSALDLYKAGIAILTPIASLGKDTWDFIDRRHAVVNRSGITRSRPAFMEGWECEFDIQVLLPEYITPGELNSVLVDAGRLCGFGDYRPTYGRFALTQFDAFSM